MLGKQGLINVVAVKSASENKPKTLKTVFSLRERKKQKESIFIIRASYI